MAPLRSLGNALSSFRDFYSRTGTDASLSASPGVFSASGGNQTSATGFTSGSYTYHVFTSSGALTVSGGSSKEIQYLVIAGGGGGGYGNGGAGGAGGLRTNDPSVPADMKITSTVTLNPGPHTITVGDGGGSDNAPYDNRIGGNSSIGSLVVASGGGGGGPYSPSGEEPKGDGGSGGGSEGHAGSTVASPDPLSPSKQGYDGKDNNNGGGGGGAGGTAPSNTGGAKLACPAFSSPVIHPGCPMPAAWQSYVGPTGTYAGGGYGYPARDSSHNAPNITPNSGLDDYAGIVNTGGGADSNNEGPTRKGGKGIVIIRYLT